MTTAYPGAVDALARPSDTTYTNDSGYELDVVIDNISDAIEAVETKVGINAPSGTHLPYVYMGDAAGKGLYVPTHVLAADNPILNGGFTIWPTGTSFAAIANGAYSAEMWKYVNTSAAVHTVSQSGDAPAVAANMPYASWSILVDCTTADASVAAGDHASLQTFIEGFNWSPYAQRTFTLSFWVKATKTGTYCVAFRNSGSNRSYIGEYTVSASATWEFKSIQVTASPTGGTWDYTAGIGLVIAFTLMCGSTYQTTAGSWATGDYYGTSSQANACDSTSNDFRLYGVKITPGNAPSMFVPRNQALELAMVQRYYEQSYSYGTAAGSNTSTGLCQIVSDSGATNQIGGQRFRVSKRNNPSTAVYAKDGTSGRVSDTSYNTTASPTAVQASDIGTEGFRIVLATAGTFATTTAFQYHWAANSRF